MYFIESVSILSSTGTSGKGALLQSLIRRFEHILLTDETALKTFIRRLQILVAVCNSKIKGKTVYLQHYSESRHILANNGNDDDSYIFSVSYVPVKSQLSGHQVCDEFTDALWILDRKIFTAFCDET